MAQQPVPPARSRRGSVLFGADARPEERVLASATGAVGAAAVVGAALARSSGWTVLQHLLAATVAFDVVGGVVANGLSSAKRDRFGAPPATVPPAGRLVRRPVLFSALHVHPVLVALVYAPDQWVWGLSWYLFVLASVVAVRSSPLYLERPVALACCAVAALGSALLPSPALWSWLPVMLALKLVLAHAVQEEPYGPGAPKAPPR